MPDVEHLSPDMQAFIERVGLYYARYGLPRIGGRILGLLLVAERPLTLDDLAGALQVSRASVSTNVRMAVTYGFAEQVGVPGDRRDFYQFPESGWDRALIMNIEAVKGLQALAKQGVASVNPDDPDNAVARDRLEEMHQFSEILLDDSYAILENWRTYRQARQKKRA